MDVDAIAQGNFVLCARVWYQQVASLASLRLRCVRERSREQEKSVEIEKRSDVSF